MFADRTVPDPATDPQGPKPDPTDDGAFQPLGRRKKMGVSRGIFKEYGIGGMTAYDTLLGEYQNEWMQ